MQIVIDIPDVIYEHATRGFLETLDFRDIRIAIMKGTPLPKGHGRLVDADAITKHLDIFKQSFVIHYDQLTGKAWVVCTAPSVIEADKEDEECR